MLPEITKKDLGYWILILVLAIITILTWRLGDNPDVIGYLGFGGTIASILLAVVALIYSFFQTAASGNTTAILEDSAERIEVVTKSLERVDGIAEIAQKLEDSLFILESVNTNVKTATGIFEEGTKKFESLYAQKVNDSGFNKPTSSVQEESSELLSDLELMYKDNDLTKIEFLILYSLLLVNKEKKVFNLKRFSIFFMSTNADFYKSDIERSQFRIRMLGYFDAIALQYSRNKLVKINGSFNDVKVYKYDTELEKLILKKAGSNYEGLILPTIDDITEH